MEQTNNNPVLVESVDFTLPNGRVVQIGPLKKANFDNITKWIRLRYMQNIREVVKELPTSEQTAIITHAAKDAALMSVRTEDGLKVLYESIYGYIRLCYELIIHPNFSFEDFCNIIVPEDTDVSDGAGVLNDMFFVVYNKMFVENADSLFERALDDVV